MRRRHITKGTTKLRRMRVQLKRRDMPLPKFITDQTDHDSVWRQVDSVRLLMLQGRRDSEIRRILKLDIHQFRFILSEMRTTVAEREKSTEAYGRYCDEHERFRIRQEEKLKILHNLYEDAIKPDPIDDTARDVRAARRILKDMSDIDESIRHSEATLLGIKTQMGLLDDKPSEDKPLFTSTNLREAWRKREQEKITAAIDITPVKK